MGTDDRRQPGAKERELAQQMLARAAEDDQSPEGLAIAAEHVLSHLYQQLERLVGLTGYEALLRRALFLARVEAPFLQKVKAVLLPNDVQLEGLQASIRGNDSAVIRQGLVAVLANFIWLLVTFVGEELALRLIRQACPEVSPSPGSEENDA